MDDQPLEEEPLPLSGEQKDNNSAVSNAEHDKGSLYERGKQFLTIKESKLSKERERKVNQGSTECTFQPNISKKSKNMTREESLYEYNNKWKSKVDHNIEELRAKQLKREEEQILAKPSPLSVVSQFIIQKKQEQKEYSGPITGWEKRFDEYRHKNQLYFDEEYNFAPRINEKSTILASKNRSEAETNPFERLYGDSKKKKDEELSSPKDKKKASDYDDERRRAEAEFYKKAVERHLEAEKKKAKMKEDQDDQYSFKPAINKHSKDIAKHLERAPLYSPKKSSSPSQTQISLDNTGPTNTSTNSNTTKPDSPSPTKKKFEVDNFIQRRLAKEKQRQDKITQLKNDIIEEEMKECTFKPSINQKSVELAHLWIESFDNDLEELYEFDPRYSQSTPKPFLKKNSSPGLSSSKKEKSKPSPVRQSLKSSSSNIIESIIDDAMKSIEMERSMKSTPKSSIEKSKESTKEIVTPRISESNRKRYSVSDDEDDDFVSIENEMKSAIQEFEEEWSKYEGL